MKKNIIIIVIILIIIAVVVGVSYNRSTDEYKIKQKLGDNQELLAKYEKIKSLEEKSKKDEEVDVGRLFVIGMEWKGLGDLTKDKFFYQKSLEVYQAGIEAFGDKNVLVYWNAGKSAEYLEDYELAESYYRKSIEITPSYDDPYKNLADLYKYFMKKSSGEIIALYDQGIEATMGSANLFLEKCSYLRQESYDKEALACYKLLSENYPDNQGYKDVIAELEVELQGQ